MIRVCDTCAMIYDEESAIGSVYARRVYDPTDCRIHVPAPRCPHCGSPVRLSSWERSGEPSSARSSSPPRARGRSAPDRPSDRLPSRRSDPEPARC